MQRGMSAVVVLLTLCLAVTFSETLKKRVVGYYPVWKYRSPSNPVKILDIPYTRLTHINFAFLTVLPDGRIVPMDTLEEVTELVLKGTMERGRKVSLIDEAHRNGVKVLASIGGWADSEYFTFVARSKIYRENFARNCARLIEEYGFDGVDIDWEFPGYAPHNGVPEDRENFTLLLREIRRHLDSMEVKTGKSYELTAALPASMTHLKYIELEKVDKILDYHNIMTYDYYGTWDSLSNYNSPLYFSGRCGDRAYCIDGTVKIFTKRFKIAPERLNIGVPFYGRAFAGCTGPCMPHNGPDTVMFRGGGYRNIVEKLGMFERVWDDKAKVPYLVNRDHRVFVSYDDEESIRCKVRYVTRKGLGGVIIWEITSDYIEDGEFRLMDVIYDEFTRPVKKGLFRRLLLRLFGE